MGTALLLLGACVELTVAWAELEPDRAPARPAVLAPFSGQPSVDSIEAWEQARAPLLREMFETHVYGVMPEASTATEVSRRVIAEDLFGGKAVLEEVQVRATATFNGITRDAAWHFLQLMPVAAEPVPVIVMETFCRNHQTIPVAGVHQMAGAGPDCRGNAVSEAAMTFVFGRYIAEPPLEEIIARGYGLVTFAPGEYVPDSKQAGLAALERLAAGHDDPESRWGAIAAWAWGFSRVTDILQTDDRIDGGRIAAYGHSRYGKAALLAGAFDPRIDAVISHQSGAGGASLNRDKRGETVARITDSYPFWFAPAYAAYGGRTEEMPVDQHQLLALLAPRPVFLGNARRDVWSDPAGSFVAAEAASQVWALYGQTGLAQPDLRAFRPEAGISFWIRPGTHGVTEEDWPAFLAFLDAHFG